MNQKVILDKKSVNNIENLQILHLTQNMKYSLIMVKKHRLLTTSSTGIGDIHLKVLSNCRSITVEWRDREKAMDLRIQEPNHKILTIW